MHKLFFSGELGGQRILLRHSVLKQVKLCWAETDEYEVHVVYREIPSEEQQVEFTVTK